MNLTEKIKDPESPYYMKAYVCGNSFEFSSHAINDFLGKTAPSSVDRLPSKVDVVKEITGGKHLGGWLDIGIYPSSKLLLLSSFSFPGFHMNISSLSLYYL